MHANYRMSGLAACAKVAKGQFHDAHTEYNDSVRELLNKVAVKLNHHQCHCKPCEEKNGTQVPPPYFIKQRLYKLSRYLRFALTLGPGNWRRPWFSSDRWRDVVFADNAEKPCKAFFTAFEQARREEK